MRLRMCPSRPIRSADGRTGVCECSSVIAGQLQDPAVGRLDHTEIRQSATAYRIDDQGFAGDIGIDDAGCLIDDREVIQAKAFTGIARFALDGVVNIGERMTALNVGNALEGDGSPAVKSHI